MNATTQAPQSIGQVLDAGFRLYRASFSRVIGYALSGGVIAFLPNALQLVANIPRQGFAVNLAFGLASLVLLVLRFGFYGAIVHRQNDLLTGDGHSSFADSLAAGIKRLPALFGGVICFGLVLAVSFLVVLLASLVGSRLHPVFGALLAVAALALPTWFMVSMSLFVIVIVVERKGPIDGIARSRELVSGHWWRLAAILTVATIALGALYLAVMSLAALLLNVGNVFSALSKGLAPTTLTLLAFFAVLVFVGSIVGPLIYAISLAAYRDLIARKEGGDLAARIAASA